MTEKKRKTSPAGRRQRAGELRESDLASDIQGRNKLQGDDQLRVRNERRVQPRVGGASGRRRQEAEGD